MSKETVEERASKKQNDAWAKGPSLRARAARVVAEEAREEAEKIAREYEAVIAIGPEESAGPLRAKLGRYKEMADRLDAKAKALESEDAASPEVEAFKAWGRTHHKTAEERADRLHERAAKARAEAHGRMAAVDRIINSIPVGQPILIGHHSEKRHRRDIERMRSNLQKGFEASDKAKGLERRAQAVEENRAISSDDPDALPKLRERLAEAQANADAIAAGIRALKRLPKEKWRDPEATKGIPASVRSFADVMGFAPTATNARADVRRLAKRIEELEQRQAAPTRTAQYGDVTVREEGNRTQLVFPGKPSEEVREELKAAGFRWAPSEGVWQRHRSSGAWYQAEQIAKRLAR